MNKIYYNSMKEIVNNIDNLSFYGFDCFKPSQIIQEFNSALPKCHSNDDLAIMAIFTYISSDNPCSDFIYDFYDLFHQLFNCSLFSHCINERLFHFAKDDYKIDFNKKNGFLSVARELGINNYKNDFGNNGTLYIVDNSKEFKLIDINKLIKNKRLKEMFPLVSSCSFLLNRIKDEDEKIIVYNNRVPLINFS